MEGTHNPTKIPASLLSGPNSPNHKEIENKKETKAAIMLIFIFVVGLFVSSAVCYALFADTIHEMGTNEQKSNRQEN